MLVLDFIVNNPTVKVPNKKTFFDFAPSSFRYKMSDLLGEFLKRHGCAPPSGFLPARVIEPKKSNSDHTELPPEENHIKNYTTPPKQKKICSSDDDIMIIEDQCFPPDSQTEKQPDSPQNKRRTKHVHPLSNYVSVNLTLSKICNDNYICNDILFHPSNLVSSHC